MFQSAYKGRFKIFSKNTSTINISTEINKINNLSPYNNEEKKMIVSFILKMKQIVKKKINQLIII